MSVPWEPSEAREIGKAVHAAVFGGAKLHIIQAVHEKTGKPVTDFKTKAAKDERDFAVSQGLIPMLQSKLETIETMAEIARDRFDGLYGGEYHAERVAIWECPRTGGWRRGMLDSSAKSAPIIVDFKTTKAEVDDQSCIKRIFDHGMHIQAAAYEEAMECLNPEWAGRVRFFFQWQEQQPPYALSRPIEMKEAAMTLGREQWRAAGPLWDAAVKRNHFPGYGDLPVEAHPKPWTLSSWQERMETDNRLIPMETEQ